MGCRLGGQLAHHLDLQAMRLLLRPGEVNLQTFPGGCCGWATVSIRRVVRNFGCCLLAWLPRKWHMRTTSPSKQRFAFQHGDIPFV